MVQAFSKTAWQLLEVKELTCDPGVLLRGIYLRELKTYTDVHRTILDNGQKVETTQMSVH